jgi:anti-sigma B factor antagonist
MRDHAGNEAQAAPVDGTVDANTLSIACRRDGTTGVVDLTGELDLGGGDAVEATVARLVADGIDHVAVRADGLTFIDSSGLGGLLAARAMVVDAGGEFRFGPMTAAVARVIDLAGVSDLLGPPAA